MAIIPDPGVYAEQTAMAQQAYDRALSSIKSRQASTYQQYGLTADTGSDGQYSNVRVDPTAKYGLVQMLKYNQGNDLQGAYNDASHRGLGHMGLGAQNESRLRFQQGADTQALGNSFVSQLTGLYGEQQGALGSYEQAKYQAQQNALMYALQNQSFTPAPYEQQEQPPADDSSSTLSLPNTPSGAQLALAQYLAKSGTDKALPKIGTLGAANIIKTARRGY